MCEKYKADYCELLKEILCAEANISKCFDLLLSRTMIDEFSSIQDPTIKIKLLSKLVSCYNERTNSLGKLLYNYSDLIIILNQLRDSSFELNDNLGINSDEDMHEKEFNYDDEYKQIDKYNSDLDI